MLKNLLNFIFTPLRIIISIISIMIIYFLINNFSYLKEEYELINKPLNFIEDIYDSSKNYIYLKILNDTKTNIEKSEEILEDIKIQKEIQEEELKNFTLNKKEDFKENLEHIKNDFN